MEAAPLFLERGFRPIMPEELGFPEDTTPAAQIYLFTLQEALQETQRGLSNGG